MMSARAAATISAVTPMRASNRTPVNLGLLRDDAICAARAASRAYSTTSRPARAATPASAVPQAPAPITATELYEGIDALRLKSSARVGKPSWRRCICIEQPSRAGRGIHRIDQTQCQPLGTGPGDHRAIVGAERRRRYDQGGLGFRRDVLQRAADRLVGSDAPGSNKRARRTEPFRKQPQPDAQPVGRRFQHRRLKARAEIADVLRLERIEPAGLVAHRRLQSGQREMGFAAPEHRPWKRKPFWIAA